MKTIRVLVVAASTLVRKGLRAELEASREIEVVGETGEGSAVPAFLKRARPDVLVAGFPFPGLDGAALAAGASCGTSPYRIVLVARRRVEEDVFRALLSGVSGYLLEDDALQDLGRAVRTAATGATYLCSWAASVVTKRLAPDASLEHSPTCHLSGRQEEVLRLTGQGLGVKEIAQRLGLSVKTVYTHRDRLFENLGGCCPKQFCTRSAGGR